MDHHSILRRASDHHARLLEETARGHLVARGAAEHHAGNRQRASYRLGAALVQLGRRLQGTTPVGVKPVPLPDPAASTSNSQ